jgi:NADPH-dependent curcumin reductase
LLSAITLREDDFYARSGSASLAVDRFVGVIVDCGCLTGSPNGPVFIQAQVIGQPKPGETVVVAAASGPVGSLVGQLLLQH